MASAGDPAAPIVFHEEEDLLDDDEDDDGESFDHYDDDSASSAPVAPAAPDRPPPPLSAAQVTIAVPGLPDPHHHQPEISVPAKKPPPPPPDESRKLFQRLWTDEDEIELLQGFLDYTTLRCGPHTSSQHHHDTTAFYDQIRNKFQLDFNKNQLVEKLRRLKKKYRNVIGKFGTGKDHAFKTPHEQATFEISSKIWGNTAVNGAAAYRAAPVPIDDDDDSLNNPNFNNFVDCQSPNLNGIDINAKTPRSRKRNRVGAVKLEEKQHNAANINIGNAQPVSAVAPMAAPVIGLGITGSLSGVIEETVKSCLSPIFKELLSNSMSPNLNSNGLPCCGNGFGLGRSPIPLCLGTSMGSDKERWRKQQILELEVFSKRLELVQDEIRDQLQELRSTGN
ncbi:hypothetical protein SASPL_102414 [Salvia splendens]|uniref:Glabrous enhancer-binding protein-like DBD domain-containing protein n=1 Tax=Salvia splendens TaxID=180675 RepID=A0A8X8YRV2_SALSN|nr:probable transcription factor At3g04930 [Salvia splendens]KAG6437496.1 hypothetical protein SASPL_102414 [Salvia splendens]